MKTHDSVSMSSQILSFLSIIRDDINHFQKQQERISDWMQASQSFLNESELTLLEELQDEYKLKIEMQKELLKEFQRTLLRITGVKLKKVSEC